MLLRQLHRPLSRSVTAAWRPATTSVAAAFHHGDSRSYSRSYSISSTAIDGDEQQQQQQDEASSSYAAAAAAAPPKPMPRPSLFEEFFPDDARNLRAKINRASDPSADADADADAVTSDESTPKNSWLSQLLEPGDEDEEPPRLAPPEDLLRDDEGDWMMPAEEAAELYSPALRAKGMLILSGASKNLAESDFLRLGLKGKHVEGWVGGIIKVIQARDPDTLDPKGHYFILFDSAEAAVAYKDRIEHLWSLGKTYVPGAHHGRRHQTQQPLPPGLRRTDAGEDVATLVRSFTLVPPSQRLDLQLSRVSPARIVQTYLEGGFAAQLAARAGSEFLVLVRLDGGRLPLHTLVAAIRDDGVHRNLAWRITDLEKGILPFGKSIIKRQDRAPWTDISRKTFVDEVLDRGVAEGQDGDGTGTGEKGSGGKGTVNAVYGHEEEENKYRQYPRFVIPFVDEAEARRFVQSWHRRELKFQMGGGGRNQPSWEETRIVNATVLW